MGQGVHGFQNLPLLFGGKAVEEGDPEMGFTRKNTGEKLDKIVQFVHHYQTQHPGDTPSMKGIANELDVHPGSITWFLNLLIDDNRMEKISHGRPLRLRILEHPKNRAAIKRLERALEAAKALENGQHFEHSDKGIALPPPKPVVVEPTVDEPPASVAAQIEPPAPAEKSSAPAYKPLPFPRPKTLWEAEQNLAAVGVDPQGVHGRDVLTLPTIKTAPTGMLLEELLERGYTISRTR